MVGSNTLHSLREFSFRILDNVTLIQNAVVPVQVLEACNVVANYFIRSNHDVVRFNLREESASFSRIARVENGFEVIRILENLIVPVTSERWRADNEGRQVHRVRRFGFFVALCTFKMFAR